MRGEGYRVGMQTISQRLMLGSILAMATCVALSDEAGLGEATIGVGGEEVVIPFPQGFVRTDGISSNYDSVTQSFLPATNRMLIHFGSEVDRAALAAIGSGSEPEMARTFNVQVMSRFRDENISPADFKDVIEQTKKEVAGLDLNEEFAKLTGSGNEKLGDVTGQQGDVSITAASGVGILEEGDDYLSFGMEVDAGSGGGIVKAYAVASIVRVHGKVINLYAHARPSTAENREWAKSSMVAWRGDVLADNAGLAATMAAKPTTQISRGGGSQEERLGTIVGIVVGIGLALGIVYWLQRRKANTPSND